MTKLYTDTSANLPLALLREYDIAVIPFSYTVNGVAEDYNEETDFDGKAFYDAMRRGAEVKTSMVNPATAAAFFERALAQGDDVLYVGMSGGISGTAHAAALAAEELREKYPHAKIMTIDTYAASLGEGLQVLEAAELLRAGRSFEEVGDRILARRPHMCQFFTVDDLNYLKRGGRISGAAALVGAVGTALGNMVGSLTVGKKKYAAVEADILVLNRRAAALRKRLEGLVQADADAFTPLAAAYKLPKETPEQQAHKAAVLEAALEGACAVPLEIMSACCEGITLAAEYAEKGSVMAVSDAGCAALFCKAALQAAGLNVSINTRLMADNAHAAALNAQADAMLAEFVPQADQIHEKLTHSLRG